MVRRSVECLELAFESLEHAFESLYRWLAARLGLHALLAVQAGYAVDGHRMHHGPGVDVSEEGLPPADQAGYALGGQEMHHGPGGGVSDEGLCSADLGCC